MESRKQKTASYRKHKTSTPYQRPKGMLQKVKDWLTPSKWTNPWDEEEETNPENEQKAVAFDHASQGCSSTTSVSQSKALLNTNNTGTDREKIPQSAAKDEDEKREEFDEVTPIPVLNQKVSQPRQEALFNGIASGSFLQRFHRPSHTSTSSPSSSTGPARIFTSTPYVTGAPTNKHVDTPRPVASSVARGHKTQQLSYLPPAGRPSFSVSTFHSPTRNLTDLSLSRSPFVSPFYSGRIAYGGALNRTNSLFRKRSRTETTPPDNHMPSLKQVVKPRPPSFSDAKLASQTACKILDTLQSLSSPLHDARKLPLRVASPAKRIRLEQPQQSSSAVKSPPPPVSSLLSSPAPPSLSTVRQPVVVPSEKCLPQGTKTVTIDLTTEPLPGSSSRGVYLSSPPGIPSTGKIRPTKKHSSHYSSKRNREEGDTDGMCLSPVLTNPIPLSIPSSITILPISLPPLTKTNQSAPALRPSPAIGKSPLPAEVPHPKSQATPTPTYSFTSPLPVATKSIIQTTPTRQTNMFEFSNPKVVGDSKTETVVQPLQLAAPSHPTNREPLPLKSGSVLDALKLPEYQLENIRRESKNAKNVSTPSVAGSSDSPAVNLTNSVKPSQSVAKTTHPFGFTVPMSKKDDTSTEKGSKSDELMASSSTKQEADTKAVLCLSDTSSSQGGLTRIAFGTGLTTATRVSSGSTGISLSSGTGLRPGIGIALSTSSSSTTTSSNTGKITLAKSTSGQWECPECWVSNNQDKISCAACNAPREQGGKNATAASLSSLIPLPSSNWECPTCLISNKSDCQSCLACGEKKPGISSTSTAGKTTPTPLALGEGGGGLKLSGSLFSKQAGPADLSGKGLKIGFLAQSSNSPTTSGTSAVLSGSGLKLGQPALQLGSVPLPAGPPMSFGPGLKLGEGGLTIGGKGLKLDQTQSVGLHTKMSMPVGLPSDALMGSIQGSLSNTGESKPLGLKKMEDSSSSSLPRLPILSPLSSKPVLQSAGLSTVTTSNGNMSKLPTLTPFSVASSSITTATTQAGISIPRPNITDKTFADVTFTPIHPPSVSTPIIPSSSSTTSQPTPTVNLTGTFSKPVHSVNALSANPLSSAPGATGKPSFDFKIPQNSQAIFSGSKLPFGQQQPIGTASFAPPLAGFSSISSSSSFVSHGSSAHPTTGGANQTTRPAKGISLAFGGEGTQDTTGLLNHNAPMNTTSNTTTGSAQPPAAATMGFNFAQFSSTPKLNFTSTVPPQGGTIFGPQSTAPPPSLSSNQVFQFGNSQQQSTGPSSQFTVGKGLSFGGGTPIPTIGGQTGSANPFLKGREIKKAKRRMK